MPILTDCHLHSSFSGDSNTPMEEMIQKGISLGLNTMCFTEHQDIGYPDTPSGPGSIFLINTDSYLYDYIRYKEKYKNKIRLLFGIELGLQTEYFREISVYAKSYDYDFIIGSSHVCHGRDPYFPDFYEGRSEEDAYYEYFSSILENIRKFDCFDSYGHLDYVVRYGPNKDQNYTYQKYQDVLDDILKALIAKEKALEVNTAGLSKGLKDIHPCTDILKRYKELGGELITIGSDAHIPQEIGGHFDKVGEILKTCGFRYYNVFENRIPEYIRL